MSCRHSLLKTHYFKRGRSLALTVTKAIQLSTYKSTLPPMKYEMKTRKWYDDDEHDHILYDATNTSSLTEALGTLDLSSFDNSILPSISSPFMPENTSPLRSNRDSTISYIYHDRGTIFNQLGEIPHVVNLPPSPSAYIPLCSRKISSVITEDETGNVFPSLPHDDPDPVVYKSTQKSSQYHSHEYRTRAQVPPIPHRCVEQARNFTQFVKDQLRLIPRIFAQRFLKHGVSTPYKVRKSGKLVRS